MKRIIISEEEKSRILGMHVEATKRHYGLVNEQQVIFKIGDTEYRWAAIKDEETLDKFLQSANSVNKIEGLLGTAKIFGGDYRDGGGFNLDKNNSDQIDNFVRNINNGLRLVAQLGRKLKANDLKTEIQQGNWVWKDTQEKFEKGVGKAHSLDLYATQINNIADKISDTLKLEPKLA